MFGINIWQIIFAAIAFPVLSTIGVIQMRQFEQRDFQPQTIKQQKIEQRQLSAARDLKGTWKGNARYQLDNAGNRCSDFITWELVLNISSQTDNTIGGNITYTAVSQEGAGDIKCGAPVGGTYAISGTISGTSITMNNGSYSGSFTSDTITLKHAGAGLTTAANLLRQK